MSKELNLKIEALKGSSSFAQAFFCFLMAERLHQCCWVYSRINHSITMGPYERGRILFDALCSGEKPLTTNEIPNLIRDLTKVAHETEGAQGRSLLEVQVLAAIICQITGLEIYTKTFNDGDPSVETASMELSNALASYYGSVANRFGKGFYIPNEVEEMANEEGFQIKVISMILKSNVSSPKENTLIRIFGLTHLVPAVITC